MLIRYSANALPGTLTLSVGYLMLCTNEGLAELAATAHWQDHPEDKPTDITVIHLQDVDSRDLGLFEVRYELRQVFTACPLRQA